MALNLLSLPCKQINVIYVDEPADGGFALKSVFNATLVMTWVQAYADDLGSGRCRTESGIEHPPHLMLTSPVDFELASKYVSAVS